MSSVFRKLSWLLQRHRKDAELGEELQFHLDEEAEQYQAQGIDREPAKWAARRELGNVTLVKERTRDAWTWILLEHLAQDVRYALRGFKDHPAFSLTAILSLSLGLGASLAIYTVTDNLLLRPLPYPNSSQLVMVWEENPPTHFLRANVAPRNYFVWKVRNDVFQELAAFETSHAVLGDNGRAEEFADIEASANLLPLLGAEPVLGRRFTDAESRRGSDPVMLVSFRVWQGWFNGERNILGKRVQFGGQMRTIIGVLPANFSFYDRRIDVWSPLVISPAQNNGEGRWLRCLALLKPGVTFKRAQSEMFAIARQRALDDPSFSKDWTVTLEPLRDALVHAVKPSLLVLLGAVGLLLAVACANVASLLLARYTTRQREIALRASLGAGRPRVVRQLLTESVLLALTGGVLGIPLAKWAVVALVHYAPRDLTNTIEIVTDTRIYLFAAFLAAFTSILFGLAPALTGSRSELAQLLQTNGRSSVGAKSHLRAWFVGAEIALSVVLLSGALLLFRSLEGLQTVSPGIDVTNVLTLRVSLPPALYSKSARTVQFFTRAVEDVSSLPGVRAASAISHLPFNGSVPGTYVVIAGRPRPKPGEDISATVRTVLPGYFHTMEIPFLSGRDFTAGENNGDAPYRFIVSRTFARQYLGTVNPLDQKISVWMDEKNPFGQIIGVVDDVRDQTLDQPPTPTVYYLHAHLPYSRMMIVVRSDANPLAVAEPIRRVIRSIDPAQPVADIQTMSEVISTTFSRQHFSTLLLAGFSCASLLLAAMGIYGILTYAVSERTREIGLRVAIGASPGRVMYLILRTAAPPVIFGMLIGVSGALALTGLLRGLLFNISPRDPLTFVVVPAVLTLVALISASLPARRAAHLDPIVALRAD